MKACPDDGTLLDAVEAANDAPREHLRACASCRSRVERARSAVAFLRGAGSIPRRRPARGRFLPAAALFLFSFVLWAALRPPPAPTAHPGAPQAAEVDRWIRDLGSDDPNVRRQAELQLIDAGRSVEPELRKALESKDAEIRGRARNLLDRLPPVFEKILAIPSVGSCALSPDGTKLAYYPPGGDKLEVRSVGTGNVLWSCAARCKLPISKPAFSPDGSRVYAFLDRWRLSILDAEAGRDDRASMPEYLDKRTDAVSHLEAGPCEIVPFVDGRVILNTRMEQEFREGSAKDAPRFRAMLHYAILLQDRKVYNSGWSRALYNADGSILIGVLGIQRKGRPTFLYKHSVETNKGRASQMPFEMSDTDFFAAPADLSAVFLATPGEDQIRVLSGATLVPIESQHWIRDAGLRVSALAVDSGGRWVAVGSEQGEVRIYDAPSGGKIAALTTGQKPLDVRIAGSVVAVSLESETQLYRRR
jgi:hypothetical protein